MGKRGTDTAAEPGTDMAARAQLFLAEQNTKVNIRERPEA